jgi:hypothetical protein
MQGSSVHRATRNRLSEPEDDWLGEVSDYDWSENAAAHAEAGRVGASPESDAAAVDDTDWEIRRPATGADAHRAAVERRRLVAGLGIAGVLGVVIVVALLLLRGGPETPVSDEVVTTPASTTPASTTPASTTPSTTPETSAGQTPTQETPVEETPNTTPSTSTPAGGSSFTLPEGTKLRVGDENDPAVVEQLQQTLVAAGYDPGAVDGTYGPATEAAVTAFQQDNGLSADGVVGPDTASALNSAVASG